MGISDDKTLVNSIFGNVQTSKKLLGTIMTIQLFFIQKGFWKFDLFRFLFFIFF